jgi:F0F1-type ATP synthase membrane subunit c/vacuolar-type H+-ATPase subunit K
MQHHTKQKLRFGLLTMVSVLVFTATVYAGQGFYVLDKSVRTGMLVSLTQNKEVVEPSSDKNMSTVVGVVGSAQTDFDVSKDQISVQTDGVVDTLVSTITGDVKVGDHVGPSSIVGFGAKVEKSGWAVGIAQESLDASSKGAVKSTVTDSAGVKHDVYVATIPVSVHVVYFNAQQQTITEAIPNRIQSLADSIAGKRVSQVAIVLGFLLLLAGFVIAGIIVNAAVRNGLQSIARQPLARQEIIRQMIRSFTMAIVILVLASLGTFVIIRLL